MTRSEARDPQEELAWAAGFFDAEGCFTYTESGLYASVAMAQTIREPLDRFRESVGAGTVTGPYDTRRPTRPSKQAQYQFHAYGVSRVRQIAELLWPHLGSIKRCQALRVLARAAEDHPIAAPTPEPIPPNGSPYQPPVREHLAWAAGFLEGDGSFIHAKSTRTMFVSFTQVDREVLDRFRCTVGFGKVYGPYRHRPGQALSVKPFYQLRVHGFEKVQAIAAMLWFKLGAAKRVQASRVLRQWPRECHRGHPLITGHPGCGRCTADYWESWRNGTTAASRPGSDVLKRLK
jgi:hypothetical protein